MSLFEQDSTTYQPLAARVRPAKLDDYTGQTHLLAPGKPLREAIDRGALHSMVLWGPPGVGKTTLARLLANHCDMHFLTLSAVLSGVKEIRQAVEEARQHRAMSGRKTMLFVDEAHRFNKSQQDAFLPHVEEGVIIFVGATTENPSFELNNALLSRTRVYRLKGLTPEEVQRVLKRALQLSEGLADARLSVNDDVLSALSAAADGDARTALNLLEICADLAEEGDITPEVLKEVLQSDHRRFDKGGDVFYEQISALHKAVRGSSPDAALYWFVRMLDGGCDPLYIARRVVRMATEDIGNADPRALELALNAWQVQERLGSPEGELAIAQAVIYMAVAAKSNAVYAAYNAALADVQQSPSYDVPMHIRNAPTNLMKDLGYGDSYQYAHDFPDAFVAGENYFPEELKDKMYYQPVTRGLELRIKEKLEQLRNLNESSDFKRYS